MLSPLLPLSFSWKGRLDGSRAPLYVGFNAALATLKGHEIVRLVSTGLCGNIEIGLFNEELRTTPSTSIACTCTNALF